MAYVLVTGGAGYIGSHAVKRLLKEGRSVLVIDNFSRGFYEPLETLSRYGELVVINADLRDVESLDKVFSTYPIEAVFHFAALCSVDESVEKPDLYFENNVGGTKNLLEAMSRHHVSRLIFSSTCAVYGTAQYLPIDELHPTAPSNPYGASKLEAEKIIRSYEDKGIHAVILRYFNVCGADSEGEIGDSKKPSLLLVQNAVRGALGIEPFSYTFAPVNTPDGSPVRDQIDVEDLIEAHIRALHYLEDSGVGDIFNLGTGTGSSVLEVIAAVESELNVTLTRAKGKIRKGEYATVYANAGKANEKLKWKAVTSLGKSISKLAAWYRSHPHGYLR